MLCFLATFELYKESDVWAAIQRVVRVVKRIRIQYMYMYVVVFMLHVCPVMQLQMVLKTYIPFDDEGSPLDGLTGLAFATPGYVVMTHTHTLTLSLTHTHTHTQPLWYLLICVIAETPRQSLPGVRQ